MNKPTHASLLIAALLGLAPLASAARDEPTEPKNSPTQESRQEAGDVGEAIKGYTAEKRDEAVKKAKAALDALDVRIDGLEKQLDARWDKMDKEAREKARSTMKTLREQRVKAAEWYGGMEHSTANAWEDMKKGFSAAYKSLHQSWEKAEREYPSQEQKKNRK